MARLKLFDLRLDIMKNFLTVIIMLFCISTNAQDTTDAYRLKKMEYMKNSQSVDCRNEDSSAFEKRICLNHSFQKADSIMNLAFLELLINVHTEHKKEELLKNHKVWVEKRRQQSSLNSKGYRGHHLGIIYLNTMVEMTKIRTLEIEEALKNY